MLKWLLDRRALLVLGKGGVGRSSVSTAIAAYAAGHGTRTLVIEADPRTPIAAAYGKTPGYEPIALDNNLWSMHLGGQESLEEYLSFVVPRPILRAIQASKLYQYFVAAAPAVRELTMMGKVYHEIERRGPARPPWGLMIFDAPASGQALSLIRMPFAAHETFGDSMVGREARDVASFLRDDKCALVQVTTAEPLPITETLETHAALHSLGLETSAIILNRASPAAFDSSDVARLFPRTGRAVEAYGPLVGIARRELNRRTRERRARGVLERRIGCSVIELKEWRGLSGRSLTAAMVEQLASS
ncbi:MAG: ArsA-related P-loop ATPase [Candidatus Binataceae bacterium]